MSEPSDTELQDLLAGLRSPPPDGDFEARLGMRLREVELEQAGGQVVRGPWRPRRALVMGLVATLALGAAAAGALWLGGRNTEVPLQAEPAPRRTTPEVTPEKPAQSTPPQDRPEPAPRSLDRLEPQPAPRIAPRPAPAPADRAEPAVEERVAPPERPRLDRLDISPERLEPSGAPSTGPRPLEERAPSLEPGARDRSLPERGREGPQRSTTDGSRERRELPRRPPERRPPSR